MAKLFRKYKVGIGGLGEVALAHWRAYMMMDSVEVVGGIDPSSKARAAFEDLGLKTYSTFEELAAAVDVDILCVCSPASTHESVASEAAAANCHILCEKPLAHNSESARRIVAACVWAGVKLGYGSSQRFLPALVRARELIQTGRIGEVQLIKEEILTGEGRKNYVPCSFTHYPEGSPGGGGWGLVDHGIHMLDVLPWLIDGRITSVYGRGNISGAVPGPEFAVLEFNGGAAVGHLLYNEVSYPTTLPHEGIFSQGKGWGQAGFQTEGQWEPQPASIHVYGSEGSLRIIGYPNALFLANSAGVVGIPTDTATPPIQFLRQMQAFIDAIDRDEEPPVPAEIGVHVLEVLEGIYRSADIGQKVNII